MNREQIIQMAREAGYGEAMADLHGPALERFAALVAAAEREACANVCETLLGPTATDFYGKRYAAAIRERGNT